MQSIQIGNTSISRFILGSNPFAGFSHQGLEADAAMRTYYTHKKIVETLREAEALGINAVIARADDNTMAYLKNFWDGGGKLHWFAQTCPELGDPAISIERAAAAGATACYIHGGVMDHLLAQSRLGAKAPSVELHSQNAVETGIDSTLPLVSTSSTDDLGMIPERICLIRQCGMLAGVAAHNPAVFRWAEANLDVDFYMCAYYNPTPRDQHAAHIHGAAEVYLESDRQAMTAMIQTLSKPAIHYKILAAGRNAPIEAFSYAARSMRPQDAVCVGVYTQEHPDILKEDVRLFNSSIQNLPSEIL